MTLYALGIRSCMTAYTGVAGSLLLNGSTAHSCFSLPVDDKEPRKNVQVRSLEDITSSVTISKNSRAAKILIIADVAFVDEASIASIEFIHQIDATLRFVTGINEFMGGLYVIFSGDFKQAPPIVGSNDALPFTLLNHRDFPAFMKFSLVQTQRFKNAPQGWKEFLDCMGERRTHCALRHYDRPVCPSDEGRKIVTTSVDSNFLRSMSVAIVNHLQDAMAEYDRRQGTHRLDPLQFLSTHHKNVWSYNEKRLTEQFPEYAIFDLHATHQLKDKRGKSLDDFVVTQWDEGNTPHGLLRLAVGCPVMLLRNLNVQNQLTNGTLLTVEAVEPGAIICRRFGGNRGIDDLVAIPKVIHEINVKGISMYHRYQFPLQLAFGATINKSQGKTVDHPMILDLTYDCFDHGQLYVAMTRLTTPKNLIVLCGKDGDGHNRILSKSNEGILRAMKNYMP